MSKKTTLKAQAREGIGRSAVKQTRAAGRIPGVIYGKGKSEAVDFDAIELRGVLHSSTSENILVDVELERSGKLDKRLALVQDVQHHALKDSILHVDLHEVSDDDTITAEVPLVEIGEPEGVRNGGGMLEVVLRTLTLDCKPKDLPEKVEVDVSSLGLSDSIHVSEIPLPDGVVCKNPASLVAMTVIPPRVSGKTPGAATEEAS